MAILDPDVASGASIIGTAAAAFVAGLTHPPPARRLSHMTSASLVLVALALPALVLAARAYAATGRMQAGRVVIRMPRSRAPGRT